MSASSPPLTVELVETLEEQGLPRDAYCLADEIDAEAVERVLESAAAPIEVRLTIQGIPLVVTPDGPRVPERASDDERELAARAVASGERKSPSRGTGDDDAESSSDDDSVLSPCPRCGDPVLVVTSAGPMAHRAQPCGCRVGDPSLE